jgi:hypothetical protein
MNRYILPLVGVLLFSPSGHAEEGDEVVERPIKLVRTISSQDGSMKLEIHATVGEWPEQKIMVRDSKTGEHRDLPYGYEGMPVQGTPLISNNANIVVVTVGSASSGTSPCILRKNKDGSFEQLEIGEFQNAAWECAVSAKVIPEAADPNHIYLRAFAIDEKQGIVKIAVEGDAYFKSAEGKFKQGRNQVGPFGVCYDYNHGTWRMMKELPKNWKKQMEPVRTASEPVIQQDKKR